MTIETEQLSIADVRKMTPRAIDAALKAGQFTDLLAGHDPGAAIVPPSEGQITDSAMLKAMTPGEIMKATKEGRFDLLLRGVDVQQLPSEDEATGPEPDADQGARGEKKSEPWHGMSAHEIAKATERGDFDLYLRGEGPTR